LVKARGFGFIDGDDGNEYFFHRSACGSHTDPEHLKPGDRVGFTPTESPKGMRAEHVELA
jgi:cold shock CspA family protein